MNISKNLKSKIFSKESIISLILVITIFILDRISKISIINHLVKKENIFVNNYLNFDLIWNTGIGFGLLSQNANIYYHVITLIILSVIFFFNIFNC
jgi:lipoprotein signal peptidase